MPENALIESRAEDLAVCIERNDDEDIEMNAEETMKEDCDKMEANRHEAKAERSSSEDLPDGETKAFGIFRSRGSASDQAPVSVFNLWSSYNRDYPANASTCDTIPYTPNFSNVDIANLESKEHQHASEKYIQQKLTKRKLKDTKPEAPFGEACPTNPKATAFDYKPGCEYVEREQNLRKV